MSEKLEKTFGKGWYEQLSPFLHSKAFIEIGRSLIYESQQLKDITPPFSLTFRAFSECRWDQLHTVILGLDPYPGKLKENYIADGIAFSSRLSQKAPKSLNQIFMAIEDDFNESNYGSYKVENFDLTRWANQGILLINCALSYPLGAKSGAHIKIWEPFIDEVITHINDKKDGISFILMGADARKYAPYIDNPSFQVVECEHPSAASYHGGKWKHEKVFSRVMHFQKFRNNITINW